MADSSIRAFFNNDTFTVSYVVRDSESSVAAVIDSVLDFDPAAGRTATYSADAIIDYVSDQDLDVAWILDTHVHADHLSAAAYLKNQVGGRTAIGRNVSMVQETFKSLFNLTDFVADGSQFDRLFDEGDTFSIGGLEVRVLNTPGHTPACITYIVGDAAFVGDTLFMPDYGTARTDFPGGSAETLYNSIQRILSLPDDTRLYMCHDYKAPGRDEYAWETTVRAQRDSNVHINDSVSLDQFVDMREERDSKLGMPRLILPSVQVNVRAGALPEAEDNAIRYLKLPLNAL